MALVYGATSGVAEDLVPLVTPTGSVQSRVLDMTSGTLLPDGSYVGQPAVWDGAAWVPLAIGDPLRVDVILPVVDTLVVSASASVTVETGFGGLSIDSSRLQASHENINIIPLRLRFFDTGVGALKQSITGQTAGDITASLIAALVNYGLASDMSTSPIVSTIGWNAGATVTQQTLPAGHRPGLYQQVVFAQKVVGATTGTVTTTALYSDPVFGAQTLPMLPGVSLVGTGRIITGGANATTYISDGTAPLEMQWVPAAITGAPNINLYSAAILIGAL